MIIAAYNEEENIVKTVRSLETANLACDYLIVNDDFDTALTDLKTIIRAERLRMSRQKQRHDALISKLLAD